jgi:hypothetical protein
MVVVDGDGSGLDVTWLVAGSTTAGTVTVAESVVVAVGDGVVTALEPCRWRFDRC